MTYYTQALQNVRKLTSTYIINITTTYFIHSLEARWTLLKCAGELLSLNITGSRLTHHFTQLQNNLNEALVLSTVLPGWNPTDVYNSYEMLAVDTSLAMLVKAWYYVCWWLFCT